MKARIYMLQCLCISLLLFVSQSLFAQSKISPDNPLYPKYKEKILREYIQSERQKTDDFIYPNFLKFQPDTFAPPPYFKACKEFIPIDSTYSVVPFLAGVLGPPPFYRNDDASTAKITIPFDFCFYGTPYHELYINNNGNVSFDGPHPDYRPDSLPVNDFRAVAAFWADIDTRNFSSGVVYYKITAHYLIITWDKVGYYNAHADKKNTFQMILSDGLDSTYVSKGKNIGFRYDMMEWTTGDIGGSNGFSLNTSHATVGANKSDSVNFVQFGRFGIPGISYDGPYAGTDGVSWLNGRVLEFNACSGTNIEPIVNNFNYCDTIFSCVGDTNLFNLSFLSPEIDQTTITNISTTAPVGLTILQNTSGIVSDVKVKFTGEFANVGFQHITFSASDNGTPPATTTMDVIVKVENLIATLNISGAGDTICPSSTILLTATPGFQKYKWSNNAITNPIQAHPGDYWVVGKMGKCYMRSDTVHVYAIPVTYPIIVGDSISMHCLEDSTLLSVSNTFPNYLWSNGDTTQSTYAAPGNPTVTIIDTNGCAVTSTFHVPQYPLKPLTILGIKTICPNDSILLRVSPGFNSYTWNVGSHDTSIYVPPGLYSVTAIDSNNCKNFSGVKNIPTYQVIKPFINGNRKYCLGDSAHLTVSLNYHQLLWNNLDTNHNIAVLQGNYYLTAHDNHECLAKSDTIAVIQYPHYPLPVTGNLGYCPGDSALLTAGAGFTDYIWSSGDSSQSAYLHAGNYTVTALDTHSCRSTSYLLVYQHTVAVPQIIGSHSVCPNDSVLLGLNNGYLHYLWSTGDSSQQILVPAGNYSVALVDSNSCNAQSANWNIVNLAVSTPTLSGDTLICANDSALIVASSGFLHYTWTSGDSSSSVWLHPGTYVLEVRDSNQCEIQSLPYVLAAYPYTLPNISGSHFYCIGDSVYLNVNPSYVHYQWTTGDTLSFTYAQSGVQQVIVEDSSHCVFRSADFNVSQYPVKIPAIYGAHFYCENDSVLLQAAAGFTQWQWSNGVSSNAFYVQAGTYSLTAIDSNGCKSYSSQFTVSPSLPQVQIIGTQQLCGVDSSALSLNSSFASYLWSNGSTQASNYVHAGSSWVQVTDSIGCRASDTITITSYALPTAYFTYAPQSVEAGENVQFLNASQSSNGNITNSNWTLDLGNVISTQTNANYTFQDSGVFLVNLMVTSEYGCRDDYREIIHVVQNLLIPNIITPNGDGENDVFKISGLNTKASNRLLVFDRWGKTVYSSNAYQNDWNAEELKDGVYYYTLTIENKKEIKGNLTLVH